MEGKQDSDDVQEERKTTLLWEKCIQQRIMVDLSEDESLHLSDLQASCPALSQAKSVVSETSIHFSDSILVRSDTVPPTKSNVDLRNQEHEDSGQNTSDEDQEELPYDGDHSKHLDFVGPHVEKEEEDVTDKQDKEVIPPCTGPPPVDINQLLLRHFSQEELLQSGRLIEAETLPEVSLLESVDDLLGSKSTRNDTEVSASISEEPSVRSFYSDGNSPSKRECEEEDKTASSPDESVAAPAKCEESQVHMRKVSHLRSRSFGELKYGQGQVHYPLPDFSKVAPKVKIPKGPSGPVRLVPQVPSPMVRAQSEPGMLEVISRVLEDSGLQPSEMPQVLKDTQDQTGPDLVHHFKDEYDQLLAKYGRVENLFLELSSDICNEGNPKDGSHVGSEAPHILALENNVEKVKLGHQNEMKPNTFDQDGGSEAEKMTAELRAVLSHFMQTVDEFKQSVTNMSASTEEQRMILRSLMEAQDQLERKYMSKKEEHRAMEMKNDLGLCRNIGTFDPNRLVEGDIFRAGMHLEDIKEMIDKSTCERSISPLLWSTPTTNKLSVKATPPPAQHQGSSVSLIAATKSEAQLEDESSKNDRLKERSELICNDSIQVNRFSVSVEGPLDSDDEENREEEEGRASGGISGKWTSGRSVVLLWMH
ncbi:protein AKNAD1 [Syngnathus scovelli]|uniref:protein AKNAD1 n=1 Tax=Syngnathus scovelli TaxID=161590 RepID=UPI002110424A|nr:protein AKNAD1-like isoform X1 [Syngnathus scovelli]